MSLADTLFIQFLYPIPGVALQSQCPNGWTRRENSCYLFVTHVANDWTESEVRVFFENGRIFLMTDKNVTILSENLTKHFVKAHIT